MMYVILLVSALLILFGSIYLSRRLVTPIHEMIRQMGAIEHGNFDIQLQVQSEDEIGILSRRFNQMSQELKTYINQSYLAKIKQTEAELTALRSQIYPHFLYNTLDTISWMARAQDALDVVRLVDALTNMFRVGLSSGRDYITLREEKSHAANYLYIQKVRYQDRLRYAMEIPNEYDQLVVPKLILQPLVENAIYHGVKMKRGGGQVRVTARVENEALFLSVWDDGAGIPPERLESIRRSEPRERQKGGFGLSYIAERIRLSYGPPYGVQIDSEEGTFTEVTVCLPVQEVSDV